MKWILVVVFILVVLRRIAESTTNALDVGILNGISREYGFAATLSGWRGSDPCGQGAAGVVCTGERITSLTLSAALYGAAPPEIGLLSALDTLVVQGSGGFSGAIPREWLRLPKLARLTLDGAFVTAQPLPDVFSLTPQLTVLRLANMPLYGRIGRAEAAWLSGRSGALTLSGLRLCGGVSPVVVGAGGTLDLSGNCLQNSTFGGNDASCGVSMPCAGGQGAILQSDCGCTGCSASACEPFGKSLDAARCDCRCRPQACAGEVDDGTCQCRCAMRCTNGGVLHVQRCVCQGCAPCPTGSAPNADCSCPDQPADRILQLDFPMRANDSRAELPPNRVSGASAVAVAVHVNERGNVVHALRQNGRLLGSVELQVVVTELDPHSGAALRSFPDWRPVGVLGRKRKAVDALGSPVWIDEVVSATQNLSPSFLGGSGTVQLTHFVDRYVALASNASSYWRPSSVEEAPHLLALGSRYEVVAGAVSRLTTRLDGLNRTRVDSDVALTYRLRLRTPGSDAVVQWNATRSTSLAEARVDLEDAASGLRARLSVPLNANVDGAVRPGRWLAPELDGVTVAFASPSAGVLWAAPSVEWSRVVPPTANATVADDGSSSSDLWPLLSLAFLLLVPVCVCNLLVVACCSVLLCALAALGFVSFRLPSGFRLVHPNEHSISLHSPALEHRLIVDSEDDHLTDLDDF